MFKSIKKAMKAVRRKLIVADKNACHREGKLFYQSKRSEQKSKYKAQHIAKVRADQSRGLESSAMRRALSAQGELYKQRP